MSLLCKHKYQLNISANYQFQPSLNHCSVVSVPMHQHAILECNWSHQTLYCDWYLCPVTDSILPYLSMSTFMFSIVQHCRIINMYLSELFLIVQYTKQYKCCFILQNYSKHIACNFKTSFQQGPFILRFIQKLPKAFGCQPQRSYFGQIVYFRRGSFF